MFWTILFIIIFIAGVLTIAWLVYLKWTELRLLDPSSIPVSADKKKKQELIRQRIERTGRKYASKAQKDVIRPLGGGIQTLFRIIAGKLTAAERKYQQQKHQQAAQEGDLRVIDTLLDEAQKFMDEEVWDLAEKKLIQIISLDAHNKDAYELLGRVYLLNKDYESAKETFEFLNKLSPDNPSVIASLGEVAEKLGDVKGSALYFEKAVELSPKNPKYLDFYLEAVIDVGDVHTAMNVLDRLIDVNPDNKKIPEFESKIDEIRKKQKKK